MEGGKEGRREGGMERGRDGEREGWREAVDCVCVFMHVCACLNFFGGLHHGLQQVSVPDNLTT